MVDALAHIRGLPRDDTRAAQLSLLRRRPDEAESILVQAGLLYRAIKLHILNKNWDRLVGQPTSAWPTTLTYLVEAF